MKVLAPVTPDGQIGEGFGRAPRVAIYTVQGGAVTETQVHEVGWDVLHDTGAEGTHHARVARFLMDQGVKTVVAAHMGQGMQHMLAKMGIRVELGASGVAAAAVLEAAERSRTH